MARQGSNDDADNRTRQAIKRRGLIAGAAALAAGVLARMAEPSTVGATNGDIIHIGDNNSSGNTLPTIINTVNNSAPPYGMFFVGNTGDADAIRGQNMSGATGSAGVRGEATSSGSGVVGAFGTSLPPAAGGNGVYGYATTGNNGVHGVAASGGKGVYGISNGSAGSHGISGMTDIGIGVYGSAGSGAGVFGSSQGGNGITGIALAAGALQIVAGVYGTSSVTYGVIGNTTAPGYSGLTAITNTPGVAALAATSTNANAFAAYFQGGTVVQGDFVVFGGTKSAAVKDAAGQHRLVYCMESPESWFEDFGEAKLAGGKADVALDKIFAEIAHTDMYHVFTTPHFAEGNGLAVTERHATGFRVTERNGGATSGTFSYRVVARRKDIAGERLAKFAVPKINHPDPDKLPMPTPPKK